ncbi:MAG: FAD-dependent oxidoreductase [Candidatus Auribacterota bacterium]|jgi:NADPH-dependent 2,4-dienoyl-CoA reductase/sulfur reductase-like enzyme/peroxiredoxin family protein/TusA-related sulfurtransferase/rhodanese-related sulfurtransferase|nr:FAD-dependent oxidoreductase [Candidatus Auribacterota bacterium]
MQSSQDIRKVIIIGGVAGGASAAARARRLSEKAEIIVFERGSYISFANCGLPYHIANVIEDRNKLLVQTPESMRHRFNLDIRTRTEITRIDCSKKIVVARDISTGKEYEESYDALILSPGAEPVRPPLKGADSEKVLTLRNIPDMDAIIKHVDSATLKRAVIVGGGYIGLEMAEALRFRNIDVVMVELLDQVMGVIDPEMAVPLQDQLAMYGVDLRLKTSVEGFADNGKVLSVNLSTGETLQCDFAIMSVGVRPETKLAKNAGLQIGQRGGILVDHYMRTSDPFIYAVGDVVEIEDFVGGFRTLIPLAGPANRQGRIAADVIFGKKSTYKGTQGTGICKVFDLAVGMTGLNEKTLNKLDKPYEKVYVHPPSHASYYPGSHHLSLKLLFDPKDGKILGAQAVGVDGVDKRIDVLAVAIRADLTVFDLEDMELSYAPPYGSAKDPVNYAGFVAANHLRGDMGICHSQDIKHHEKQQIPLDVRTQVEYDRGSISGSKHIPLDELRGRLDELDKDAEYLVFCQVGLRGYLACRILDQNGFKSKNLIGGCKTYHMVQRSGLNWKPTGLSIQPRVTETVKEKEEDVIIAKDINACGLQCPGPIMQLNKSLAQIPVGQAVKIASTDPGFVADIPAWCNSTGNRLVSLDTHKSTYYAVIQKLSSPELTTTTASASKESTMVVFNSDFDRVMAAFIIANGSASIGKQVTMFFTFWGLNVLRKDKCVPTNKTFIEKMFGSMMPRGSEKLALSKMNMGGIGLKMIKGIMKQKNVESLPSLIEKAKQAGVRLVACTMSMDLMGIKPEELIDGVEYGGVAMYLDHANRGNVNLFI